jgi:hypothetical protein
VRGVGRRGFGGSLSVWERRRTEGGN